MTTNIGIEKISKYEMMSMMDIVLNAWLVRISTSCPSICTFFLLSSRSLHTGKKQEMEENEVMRMEEAILMYATVLWLRDILFILCESYRTNALSPAAPALIMYPYQITCRLASRDPSIRLMRSTVFMEDKELEVRMRREEPRGMSGAKGLTDTIRNKTSKLKLDFSFFFSLLRILMRNMRA